MTKARKRRGLGAAFILAAAAALAVASPTVASATPSAGTTPTAPPCTVSAKQVISSARTQGIGGVIVAAGTSSSCQDPPPPPEPAFNGTPPLLFHGSPPTANCSFSPCNDGDVMMTRETGPLVITPIFWDPAGHPMSLAYKAIITSYLADVALASGRDSNVFSVLNEYYGNNGQIHYNIRLGFPINDTDPLPANGCTLESADTSGIYADGSGYNACLDDTQLQAEVNTVTGAYGLPHNLRHIYVLYVAKHVESCFLPGETTSVGPNGQFCTINHQPTAAYCAYHSEDPANAVYANLDYPIYDSPVGFTCGSDARFPVVESPNGNPDADTEISPTSHEVSEAITDPDTETGWYDSTGNEIGDDCAYIYGATNGQAGRLYNQTIFGQHFLTQQEFSNRVFSASGGKAGCVDSQQAES
jgi:hypothetical protein